MLYEVSLTVLAGESGYEDYVYKSVAKTTGFVAFAVFYYFAWSLITPFRHIMEFAGEISRGVFNTQLELKRRDEMGGAGREYFSFFPLTRPID